MLRLLFDSEQPFESAQAQGDLEHIEKWDAAMPADPPLHPPFPSNSTLTSPPCTRTQLLRSAPNKKHSTGCIIKCASLRTHRYRSANRLGEALAQGGRSSLQKSLSFQSQRFSVDEVHNPVNTVSRLPKHCKILSS